ncbi:MAG: tRNA (adenosine(37)-N6)-threonylcarbamoyltransferase complex transferase subunit TsaD [Vicinamibacterales bacterium]
MPFTLLGIETSCDETSAALVSETGETARPWRIRANVVASQAALHREWGGVVPELASRQHIRDICGVVDAAFAEAGLTLDDVGAVAVTEGPGLVGSLLVGVSFAKSVALARGLPLVGVHHLAGHIESIVLAHGEMPLPAVVLVVSGGHTSLYRVDAPGAYTRLGRTRDDAAGEAFDKVAKLLGLGYPGGPVIDRLAETGREDAVRFPKMRLTHADRNAPDLPGTRDFSFSGLKTAVLRHVTARVDALGVAGPGALPASERADIAAGFQRSVVVTLVDRLMDAARAEGAASLGIAGGVSANSRLRSLAAARAAAEGLPLLIPPVALSTDNAAMIAAAGLRRLRAGLTADWTLNAHASLPL